MIMDWYELVWYCTLHSAGLKYEPTLNFLNYVCDGSSSPDRQPTGTLHRRKWKAGGKKTSSITPSAHKHGIDCWTHNSMCLNSLVDDDVICRLGFTSAMAELRQNNIHKIQLPGMEFREGILFGIADNLSLPGMATLGQMSWHNQLKVKIFGKGLGGPLRQFPEKNTIKKVKLKLVNHPESGVLITTSRGILLALKLIMRDWSWSWKW